MKCGLWAAFLISQRPYKPLAELFLLLVFHKKQIIAPTKQWGCMQRARRGFSLLEMSVVIALMGLVAGVILVSQGIQKRNEMRTVLVDANAYSIAIQQFQMKYNALPGDFPDATNIWGALTTCPSDSGLGQNKTCDGNGNGVINQAVPLPQQTATSEDKQCEQYRAWQQLSLAKLVKAEFTGISGLKDMSNNPICGANSVPSVNVPDGPVKGSGFSIDSFGNFDANQTSADWFNGSYDNALIFGGALNGKNTDGPILKTDTAKEIDAKADDGFASTGNIRAPRAAFADAPQCTVDATGTYKETNRAIACILVFTSDYNKASRY